MLNRFINLELSKNQQTIINITASVLNMLVTTLISFVLSPYIVRTLGVEANGFVSLANNFINYISLAATALNSMGSRFLMIAYYNDEHEKFRRYYSSLFFANLFLAAVFGVLGAACVWNLEMILNIPADIVVDVKLLFAFLFGNFVISTMITVWTTAPFIKNRLYLNSITTASGAAVRALMILGLFLCLEPSVCFLGAATLVSGCVGYGLQFLYKRNLFPQLRARKKDFSWASIWELISSGIWNTISCVGLILTNGLDLLVTNLFVSATAMGTLSVSHTMPAFIATLNETIASVFTPSLIMDYAQGKTDNLVKTIKQSSKIIATICSLPLGFLLVYGKEFYMLWQPTEDAQMLHTLSIIVIFGRVFFTGMQPLFNVFTVVNKVKENSIVIITNGLVSVGVMFLLLRFTDLGVFAIAGTSVVCCFIKNLLFVIPFSAKYLGLKPTTFYNTLFPSVTCCVILLAWGYLERLIFVPTGWFGLIAAGVLFSVVGLFLTTFVVLNKDERKVLLDVIKSKLKR